MRKAIQTTTFANGSTIKLQLTSQNECWAGAGQFKTGANDWPYKVSQMSHDGRLRESVYSCLEAARIEYKGLSANMAARSPIVECLSHYKFEVQS